MTADRIRVGCLGAGYFSQFHRDAWTRIDGVALIGSADSDISRARATGLPAFSDLPALLATGPIDLLDIITPPPTHFDAIRTAISAGVRKIICQKPFCSSLDEAENAVALARASETTLVVHENFRFQPWYRAMAIAMSRGLIGDVHQMTFRLRPGDGQGPKAYLDRQPYFQTMPQLLVHETAVHWIDTFQFLLGPIRAVYADLRRMNPVIAGEDAGVIIFDFANDVRAIFDGNRHLDHAAANPRLTLGEALVEGTGGTLSVTGDGTLALRKFASARTETLLPAQDWPGFGGDCVHALQSHVIAGLVEGRAIENTAQDYLGVIRVRDAIYRAAREGRKLEV